MAIVPGLQINQSQQLKLTPQLQQSIKLLQSSTLEVEQIIQQALETNYMLEACTPEMDCDNWDEVLEGDEFTQELEDFAERGLELESTLLSDNLELDTNWEEIYTGNVESEYPSHSQSDEDYTSPENYTSSAKTLEEHLTWQVNISPFDEVEVEIALTIIDYLDQDGFLTLSDLQLQEVLQSQGIEVPLKLISKVLREVQDFEPSGVACRSLQESLIRQLDSEDNKLAKTTQQLLEENFAWVTKRDYRRIKHLYDLTDEQVEGVFKLIQSLNPRPAQAFANTEEHLIRPDLLLFRQDANAPGGAPRWRLELNPDAYPQIRMSPVYASLTPKQITSDREEAKDIRNQIANAKTLLAGLKHRGETLMKVASYIIEKQADFFVLGEVAMVPMVLRDVADELGLHESTISRATSNKFMQTSRGTYELKYFFSSSVSQFGMDDQSSVAIKAHIKSLIDGENPKKPLSDAKLTELLEKEFDISIARRTLAKYREALGIGSSSERKQRF